MLFDCSRTIVREALTRLAARGIVTVSARRGWYVIEPSQDEAREAFEARRVIESGLIRSMKTRGQGGHQAAQGHLAREKAALKGNGRGRAQLPAGRLPRVPGRMPGQQPAGRHAARLHRAHHADRHAVPVSHDAAQSCDEHVQIVAALEQGDLARAER
jgi:DNA-binding GntR family transcriptional regulator